VINAKPFLLLWLQTILALRDPSATKSLRKISPAQGWHLYIRPCDNDTRDTWDEHTWNTCDARIQNKRTAKELQASGWLPTKEIAAAWRDFVRQPEHPVTSPP
jgi:hypothetical protein